MQNIVYVTGNYGKYISVKEKFEKANIDIDFSEYDFDEPNINDIEQVSKTKALEAFKILQRPCFVADSGFYIDNYPNNPGYPGAFVKRTGISENIEILLETMKEVKDRNCKFLDCLTFYDGNQFHTFFGESKGTLAKEIRGTDIKKAKSKLWHVFIPENCNKTLAEMTDQERNSRNDGRTSATDLFIKWYIDYMINQETKILLMKRQTKIIGEC